MNSHISKHEFDKYPTKEEHIYQALTNPDIARRSLDPVVGHESCVFEKFFPAEGQRFFTTAIYDGVISQKDYEDGGKVGRISTSYFPGEVKNSKHIGEIFWTKQEVSLDMAATEEETISADKKEDDK